MISVKEAKELVQKNASALPPVLLPLTEVSGLVLADDIYSNFNIPAFEQSAMDGYAFCHNDWTNNQELLLEDEIPAGRTDHVQLGVNKAIRIFTGAPLPSGADTVVMQEKITVKDRTLIIGDNELQKGTNVRKIGSEIAKGTLALQKSTKLTPGAIGFLATIGLSEVPVYRLPKVSIIVTGNEIQQPGTALQHGQVYECNSFTLRAGLQQLKIRDVQVEHAEDQPAVIQDIITRFILTSDVVLITGGVSVGDYDFVTPALRQIGVEQIFHKIKQRPGKPLYFGKKGKTLIFGLPGNPSSVLTCYYEYVVPALEKLMQMPESTIITTMLPLASPYSKKTGLSHFLKGYCAGKNVCVLTAQESYKLHSFAKANCLIFLPEEIEEFKKDDMVEVHIFPNN